MSALLDEVLAAHGGLQRWRAVTAITCWLRTASAGDDEMRSLAVPASWTGR